MTCKTRAAAHPEGQRRKQQHTRLRAALAAVLAVAAGLGIVEACARWEMHRHLNVFAEQMNSAKMLGNALQTTAFRTPDILPIYGSSELSNQADNRAEEFFLSHREGFRVFPFGRPGNTCLLILEKIAAAGPAVRGRKVAIFLSPTWFLREDIRDAEIEDNVTPVQLGAWMFGGSLSREFKQRFARRLLEHPEALEKDAMMLFCLRRLAGDTWLDRCQFALAWPVGLLRNAWMARLDYWTEFHDYLVLPPRLLGPMPQAWRQPPDPVAESRWPHLANKAEVYERRQGVATPYSVLPPAGDQARRDHLLLTAMTGGVRDQNLLIKLEHSREWADLQMLLDGLRELGADAIFINQPFNGLFRDLTGANPSSRQEFYARMAATVRGAGFPLMDYAEHEEDKYFFNDSNHPSAKAWIYYDHALDDFYHDRGEFAVEPPRP